MNDTTPNYNPVEEGRSQRAGEIRRLRRLLREMSELAEQSSLTGSFANAAVDAVEMYNSTLNRLRELGIETGPLFHPLPPDASFDRVGVTSKLLHGYLEEEEESADRRQFNPNIIIGNLGSLAEVEKLRDLGQNIRENLADLIRGEKEKVKVVIKTEAGEATRTSEPDTVRAHDPQ